MLICIVFEQKDKDLTLHSDGYKTYKLPSTLQKPASLTPVINQKQHKTAKLSKT